ncbi:unnamed protein product [Callosobruchus maculatus]|uniref:C-type lectin domain-containing protein n=1 Tax=Callosobruchus maculatus TaxID=64391 RepID=A0A653CBN9_CALMS|nr:unnamed protein product [Callosobruchus maculatus]
MSVRILVLLATFVTLTYGVSAGHNTSAISGFPKIRVGFNVESSPEPHLPLVRYGKVQYYFGAILGDTVEQVDLFCRYHGMKLVSIQTKEETANLIAGLRNYLEPSEKVKFWTSGKKYSNNNQWRWESTGLPTHYTNWAKGEPNNSGGNEACIEVFFNGAAKTLEWNDNNCDVVNYFICESRD